MKPTQLAKELIEEKTIDGVCTLSKKKLGEILKNRYPTVFTTSETARTAVRGVTGSQGDNARKQIKNRIQWNGFKLPDPEFNDFSKFVIHEKRIGILSDIHFPYYHKEALELSVKHLLNFKPDCLILNGDTIDCYQLSSFEKDPRKRSFKYELDMLRNFIIELRDLFPNTRIIFKTGNHEERYERRILQQVPELLDLEMFTLDNVIGAKALGIDYVTNKRIIKAGHLNICHGHEFRGGIIAPVNPARGYYMKAKCNVIAGHNHRTSEHIESTIDGKIIGAWSTGCLSELTPGYMPINSWNLGFATVEINGEDFSVKNLKIIKGKVV